MFDIRHFANGRTCLAAGRNAVAGGKSTDGAADGIDQDIAVVLAPLVLTPEDGRRPLAGAANANDILAHFWISIDHLGNRVVGWIKRYLHRLDRRRRDRGRVPGAIQRAERWVEIDVAQRAARREVLVPTKQLVDGDDDRAAPPGIGGIHGARLRRRTMVLKGQLTAFLPDRQHHAMGRAVPGLGAFDVCAVLPYAIGKTCHLVQVGFLAIVDDLAHDTLDGLWAVAFDQIEHALAGVHVARHLGTEVERHHIGLAR